MIILVVEIVVVAGLVLSNGVTGSIVIMYQSLWMVVGVIGVVSALVVLHVMPQDRQPALALVPIQPLRTVEHIVQVQLLSHICVPDHLVLLMVIGVIGVVVAHHVAGAHRLGVVLHQQTVGPPVLDLVLKVVTHKRVL